MTDYTDINIYPGVQYTTMTPTYYAEPISGYQATLGSIGSSVDPRTANQLGEINMKMNPGVQNMEFQGTFPNVMDAVPDQHLDETKRLAKLTGVSLSMHAPIVEASGVGEGGWTEDNRIAVENQLKNAIIRGHKLDPNGNISVTTHSAAQLPDLRPHAMITDEKGKRKKMEQGIYVINEESGQVTMIKPEKRYFPESGEEFTGKVIEWKATNELKRRNEEAWTETLSGVNRFSEYGEETIDRLRDSIVRQQPGVTPDNFNEKRKQVDNAIYAIAKASAQKDSNQLELLKKRLPFEEDTIGEIEKAITHSQIYLRDSYRNMKSLFDRAYNNTKSDADKEKLRKFAEGARKYVEEGKIQTDPAKLKQLNRVVSDGLKTLSKLDETPEMWKPLDAFAIEQSAKTYGNVAQSAYQKFGSKAPILNIENAPANQGLSTGEDLKKLVVKSREAFAENLRKKKGLSKSQADSIAKKMIGATWDVGHINMLRKKGYTEKELIEQTKKIAPFVNHVHLSDNFGLEHTELPMGMGNVPLKKMMDQLKKAGFKGKQIIEAGDWWQHFADKGGGNPFKPSIEMMDSPIYAMAAGPSWSQTGYFGAYYSGGGPINPPVHHNTYGSGFQNMPVELGGEMPGDQGRFAGAPNQ